MENLPAVPDGIKLLVVLASHPLLPSYVQKRARPLSRAQCDEQNTPLGTENGRSVVLPRSSQDGMVCPLLGEDGALLPDKAVVGDGKKPASSYSSRWLMDVQDVVSALFNWKSQAGAGAEVVIMAGGEPWGSETIVEDKKGQGAKITHLCVGSLMETRIGGGIEREVPSLGQRCDQGLIMDTM